MKKKWFIGIDISKNTLDIILYDGSNKQTNVENHLRIGNDEEGFKEFKFWLTAKKITCKGLLICMEHTGVYGFDFCLYLERTGIDYTMVSPLHITRSMGFKRGKNDKVDAIRIAWYCYTYRDSHTLSRMKDSTVIKLRELHNEHKLYVKQMATHKGYLTDSKNRKSINETIAERARQTIQYLKEQVQQIEQQMDEIISADEAFIKSYMLLTSIRGIGMVNAINAIVHTNNFTCFENGRQYACYLGIAPFEHQSGTSLRGSARVSRQGAKQAKADLSQAAKSAAEWDQEIKLYYQRKTQEGKAYGTIMNAIKFKLVMRMFAVIKRGTPWVDLTKYCN